MKIRDSGTQPRPLAQTVRRFILLPIDLEVMVEPIYIKLRGLPTGILVTSKTWDRKLTPQGMRCFRCPSLQENSSLLPTDIQDLVSWIFLSWKIKTGSR